MPPLTNTDHKPVPFNINQKQDPGYPHGANGYRLDPRHRHHRRCHRRRRSSHSRKGKEKEPEAAGPQGQQQKQEQEQEQEQERHRLLLNLSYVRLDFPVSLRKHVVTHQYYYRRHLPHALGRKGGQRGSGTSGGGGGGEGKG
jgi:hypothetical protein